jgi:hypothetical protein
MTTASKISLAAAGAFLLIILVKLPATWFSGFLPARLTCSQISGSLWRGQCVGLSDEATRLGDLQWQLSPWRLPMAQAVAHVNLRGDELGSAQAQLTIKTGGVILIRELISDLALSSAVSPNVPEGVRAKIKTDIESMRVQGNVIRELAGTVEIRELVKSDLQQPQLGDYLLTFPAVASGAAPADPMATVQTLAGPWDVSGTLRLTADPGFAIEGWIKAKAGHSIDGMESLGPADAAGRRPFSIAGTL